MGASLSNIQYLTWPHLSGVLKFVLRLERKKIQRYSTQGYVGDHWWNRLGIGWLLKPGARPMGSVELQHWRIMRGAQWSQVSTALERAN